MPNPWGANLGTYPPFYVGLAGGANVACPAGAETTVAQANGVQGYGPGAWTAGWMGSLSLLCGASPPTNITVGARVNLGADYGNQTVPTTMLVANGTIYVPVMIFNQPAQQTMYYPGSANIQLSVNPTGQAVTAVFVSSALYYWLMRVGD